MTVQSTITIEVSMFSEASEAHLNQHLDQFVNEIKLTSENKRFKSWHQSIETSWDESYPVEISVNVSVK
jgi:hypothetical protein